MALEEDYPELNQQKHGRNPYRHRRVWWYGLERKPRLENIFVFSPTEFLFYLQLSRQYRLKRHQHVKPDNKPRERHPNQKQ